MEVLESYLSPIDAAKAAIESLTTDELEINQQNLFAWLADNPPDPDDFDDLDDYLESFENLALDSDDDDDDDDEDGDE